MTQGDTAVEASQGTPKIVDETGKRTESAVGAGTLRIDHPMLALSDVATRQAPASDGFGLVTLRG